MKHLHPRRFLNSIRRFPKKTKEFILFYALPDKAYLKYQFYLDHRGGLNLKHPNTIDEKIQWIKLYDRKEIYHTMIDKIAAKSFVSAKLGTNQYTIPLLGRWKKFDDIDFSSLPLPFIIKCNHDSGSWTIVKNLKDFNIDLCRHKTEWALSRDFYHYYNRQWGYKDISPEILAEPFLEGQEKIEYQLFCNNGRPIFFLVRKDLGENESHGWNVCYSVDWHKVKYRDDSSETVFLEKPVNYDTMISIATKLSEDTLHLRVDFFEVDGNLYVGELTFYSHGGDFCNFNKEGISILSETLTLPI